MFDHLHCMCGSCLSTTPLELFARCFRSSSSLSLKTWPPSMRITGPLRREHSVTWRKNWENAFFLNSCPSSTEALKPVLTSKDKAYALVSQKLSLLRVKIWSLLWRRTSGLLSSVHFLILIRMFDRKLPPPSMFCITSLALRFLFDVLASVAVLQHFASSEN